MSHRQLLDFAAKGSFIDVHPSIAYQIIEGILGVLPPEKGTHHTQEGTQILEKLCELQKSLEPLKNVGGNLNRMNTLITLCNKRLDALDLKISEYEEKRKEPPGFEHNSIKKINTKDGNTQIYPCVYAQLGALNDSACWEATQFYFSFLIFGSVQE